MKRLIVSIVLVLIALLPVYGFSAPSIVEKPNLPAGYKNWPYNFHGTCQIDADNTLSISLFAALNTDLKESERARLGIEKLQAVSMVAINGNPVTVQYMAGDPKDVKPALGRYYLYTRDGLKFFSEPIEFEEAASKSFYEKLKKGPYEVAMACVELSKKIEAFTRELDKKMKK